MGPKGGGGIFRYIHAPRIVLKHHKIQIYIPLEHAISRLVRSG